MHMPFICPSLPLRMCPWAGHRRREDLLFVRYFLGAGFTRAYHLVFSAHQSLLLGCAHPVRHTLMISR